MGVAYIRIQDASAPNEFLRECCEFCIAAGAQRIYAAGHDCLQGYPLFTEIWEMECQVCDLPHTNALLRPICKDTLEEWKRLYNERMRAIPNAATMTQREAEKHMESGDGYFVCRGDVLLGIGIVSAGKVDCVISLRPGEGETVLLALCHGQSLPKVVLEVASANQKAVALYRRMGFRISQRGEFWYCVFPGEMSKGVK